MTVRELLTQPIYIFKTGMFQFGLLLAVTSYKRRHHGDAS